MLGCSLFSYKYNLNKDIRSLIEKNYVDLSSILKSLFQLIVLTSCIHFTFGAKLEPVVLFFYTKIPMGSFLYIEWTKGGISKILKLRYLCSKYDYEQIDYILLKHMKHKPSRNWKIFIQVLCSFPWGIRRSIHAIVYCIFTISFKPDHFFLHCTC